MCMLGKKVFILFYIRFERNDKITEERKARGGPIAAPQFYYLCFNTPLGFKTKAVALKVINIFLSILKCVQFFFYAKLDQNREWQR